MLKLINAPEDQALADRLRSDLQARGHRFTDALPGGNEHLLIALLTPSSIEKPVVADAINDALDQSSHVIPVLLQPMALPKVIDHLLPLDWTKGADVEALQSAIQQALTDKHGLPMRALTPRRREKNRGIGMWLAILATAWFIIGLIAVGIFGIRRPDEEYLQLEIITTVTIDAIIRENLPRTTDEALNFPATVQAAPTRQRPILIATATALATQNQP